MQWQALPFSAKPHAKAKRIGETHEYTILAHAQASADTCSQKTQGVKLKWVLLTVEWVDEQTMIVAWRKCSSGSGWSPKSSNPKLLICIKVSRERI